jgi:FkbM family methyltransferase
MAIPSRSFLLRHRLIAFLRNLDVRGIRRLSVVLPNILLPSPIKAGKHILKTIHGFQVLIDPAIDNGVELALFTTGTYEEGTVNQLKKILQPGNTFLDIGANIGWMSLVGAKAVGENGKVFAIEANPHTLPILQHNLALNQAKNIEVLGIAVSDQQVDALLYENWNVNRGGASLLSQDSERGVAVIVETLDRLFAPETPLHAVKIDVEGLEPQVIAGGKEWFTKQQPIFVFEISNQRNTEKGASGLDVVQLIQTIGEYNFYKHPATKERKGKLVRITDFSNLPTHDNLFAIPVEKSELFGV